MGIETNLDIDPYYDDINNALDSNYHRILFRPSVPVQARELTQLQDILQNQVERFGDNIFVTGTIIKGCNFSFDNRYYYAKVKDVSPTSSEPIQPSTYVNLLAHESTTNLYAVCVNYQDGYESQDPDLNTLYFKYINAGEYANGQIVYQFPSGSQLQFYTNTDPTYANSTNYFGQDVTVASVTNAVGVGYAMSVDSGIIFQKGHFIQVPQDTHVIVSKYTATPNNVVAGFIIEENIITELQDPTLYDGAAGYTNYNAPGAHRLQLNPILSVYNTDEAPTNNFFTLVEWQNGNIARSFQETQYSVIGDNMAKRTFENSGNFAVKPFNINVQAGNSTHNHVVSSAGIAYIEGHRIEQFNNIYTPIRKGTDLKTTVNQVLQTGYENYILVSELVGNFPTNLGVSVSIRDTAAAKITSDSFSSAITPVGNEIGTAKIISIQHDSGDVGTPSSLYRVYLSEIKMNTGKNFKDARAIYYDGTSDGWADIALVNDPTSNTYVTKIFNSSKNCLIFSSAKVGLNGLASTGILPGYIYRTTSNTLINYNTGNSNVIGLSGNTVYPYGTGELNLTQERSVMVIPYSFSDSSNAANVTLTSIGTLVLTNGSANVTANTSNTTNFLTQYQVGDYINAGNVIRRITTISNATFMIVDKTYAATNNNATHAKCYPANVPINFSQRNSTITIPDDTNQQMVLSLISANGTAETLSANINATVYYNARINNNPDRALQANTQIMVRINTSNNSGGLFGPWCLGVPYGYRLRNVYRSSNTGTFTANISSGNAYVLTSTTGFTNGVCIFGDGIPAGATANVANSTALLLSSAATSTQSNTYLRYAYYSNNFSDDVTGAYQLIDGQKDNLFDLSYLSKRSDLPSIMGAGPELLTVIFDAFKPLNTGQGYISIDSYKALVNNNIITYEGIPTYTSAGGLTYNLRDSIDFRPFVSNTAAYANTLAGATINPSSTSSLPSGENYLVAPNQNFKYSANYYVGRIDKLGINSYGKYKIIEGLAGENPKAPDDQSGLMTLAIINVPPYPSLTSNLFTSSVPGKYVTVTKTNQNRVYNMSDIGKLDKRVNNLEYYTSLSLLEQKTSNLLIPSDVTGSNRFKNGIFVDNFTTSDNLNISDIEFKAKLDDKETSIIPRFTIDKIGLSYANGVNTEINGGVVTLSMNTQVTFISQPFATDAITAGITVTPIANSGGGGGGIISPPPVITTPDPEPPVYNPTPVGPVNPAPVYTDPAEPQIASAILSFGADSALDGSSTTLSVWAYGFTNVSIGITYSESQGGGNNPTGNGYVVSHTLTPSYDSGGSNYFYSYNIPVGPLRCGEYSAAIYYTVAPGFTYLATGQEFPHLAVYGDPSLTSGSGYVYGAIPTTSTDTSGGLATLVVANTQTTVGVASANNGTITSITGNSAVISTTSPNPETVQQVSAFNTDLVSTATATSNATTSTTSTSSSVSNTVAISSGYTYVDGIGYVDLSNIGIFY